MSAAGDPCVPADPDRLAPARHELKSRLTVIRLRTQLAHRAALGVHGAGRWQLLADLAAVDSAAAELAERVDRLVRDSAGRP